MGLAKYVTFTKYGFGRVWAWLSMSLIECGFDSAGAWLSTSLRGGGGGLRAGFAECGLYCVCVQVKWAWLMPTMPTVHMWYRQSEDKAWVQSRAGPNEVWTQDGIGCVCAKLSAG